MADINGSPVLSMQIRKLPAAALRFACIRALSGAQYFSDFFYEHFLFICRKAAAAAAVVLRPRAH
jgi:hypothetical protein